MSVSCWQKDKRPAHTELSLRRSELGIYPQSVNLTINDDEAERREARRRTMQQNIDISVDDTTEYLEDNETVKKCLEIYQGNKLSRENAWSLSLIDTLSTLLDRHHKSLKNFKVAGSSLEASSKVYSLRVDSVHIDVLRMMAGLNAQKFTEDQQKNDDDDDNDAVATGGEGSNDPVASAAAPESGVSEKNAAKKSKPKRLKCMVTKNKERLNARLDTLPLQDPVFGKLNATVGSINSSNRLMNNILKTNHSVLKLRTTFPFWSSAAVRSCDYTEEFNFSTNDNTQCASSDCLVKIMNNLDNLKLRPLESGYRITDTPATTTDDKPQSASMELDEYDEPIETIERDADLANVHEMAMAFDINAECEPLPTSCQLAPVLDVNYAELDDLTMEDRTAINKCRGLRRTQIIVEDLRPVDSTSNLEYSYRPMDKISQFWAGPSHWKFKRARTRPSHLSLEQKSLDTISGRAFQLFNRRSKRNRQTLDKKKPKQLNFREFHDDRFITLDKFKNRKVNIQKKWDQKKLKLPVDLQLSPNLFQYFTLAPGLLLFQPQTSASGTLQICDDADDFNAPNIGALEPLQQDHFMDDNNASCGNFDGDMNISGGNNVHDRVPSLNDLQTDNFEDSTILEIATNFEGAPTQVTKIIVPFAKRAKIIDMKSLKRSCFVLLNKQFKRPLEMTQNVPMHPIKQNENFIDGLATFSEIYEHLPKLLTKNMSDSLSPSIALYSVLHLANEHKLRLIPQHNLEDFFIRKLAE